MLSSTKGCRNRALINSMMMPTCSFISVKMIVLIDSYRYTIHKRRHEMDLDALRDVLLQA